MLRLRAPLPSALLLAAALCCGSAAPQARPPISGRIAFHHWTEDGKSTEQAYPPQFVFAEARIPGATGWANWPAQVADDASFTIPGADPAGAYWLRVFDQRDGPIDRYYWTDARDIDLGYDVLGRPDAQVAQDSDTVLEVTTTFGTPWTALDGLEFFVPNIGVDHVRFGYALQRSLQPGSAGLDFNVVWKDTPLPAASKGDRLHVVRFTETTDAATGLVYSSPVEVFEPDPFTMSDGQHTAVSGQFVPAPASDFPLHFSSRAFSALQPEFNPTGQEEQIGDLQVTAPPEGSQLGDISYREFDKYQLPYDVSPQLFSVVAMPRSDADIHTTLHIGNPYPASDLITSYWTGFDVYLSVVDNPIEGPAKGYFFGTASTATREPLSDSNMLVPAITPATNPQIEGRDLFSNQTGVGLTPTLSWSAPRVGVPTSYEIELFQLVIQHNNFGLVPIVGLASFELAALTVPGDVTSVPLPDNLLAAGTWYVVKIRAVHEDGQDARRAPNRRTGPNSHADLMGNPFQP